MAQYRPYPSFIRSAVRKYYRRTCGKDAEAYWNRTMELYRDLVDKAPDIGGKENSMSINLYMALAVFAFYEATGRSISNEELKELMIGNVPERIPFLSSLLDFNRPLIQRRMKDKYERYKTLSDIKLDSGEWGNSWRVSMNPHGRTKGVAFDLIGCPLADFARKNGYTEIMPVLCDFDHITASLMHARLIREHTEAKGDEYCDFWYVGDREGE